MKKYDQVSFLQRRKQGGVSVIAVKTITDKLGSAPALNRLCQFSDFISGFTVLDFIYLLSSEKTHCPYNKKCLKAGSKDKIPAHELLDLLLAIRIFLLYPFIMKRV